MHHVARVKASDLNEHFICGLCFGYLIDATTIIECLHSFCRSCLVRYLNADNCCPLCGQLVHKTKPLDYIRQDKTLQDLAYKLIPHLYKDEMHRRREFYAEHAEAESVMQLTGCSEDRGEEDSECRLNLSDTEEKISICLQIADPYRSPDDAVTIRPNDSRFLLCPVYLSVSQLKKFVRMKFDLAPHHQISMFILDEDIPDHFTLTDIAVLYGWTRLTPLKIFYIVFTSTAGDVDVHTDASRLRQKSHHKRRHSKRAPILRLSDSSMSNATVDEDECSRLSTNSEICFPVVRDDSLTVPPLARSFSCDPQLPFSTTGRSSAALSNNRTAAVTNFSQSRNAFSIVSLLSLPDNCADSSDSGCDRDWKSDFVESKTDTNLNASDRHWKIIDLPVASSTPSSDPSAQDLLRTAVVNSSRSPSGNASASYHGTPMVKSATSLNASVASADIVSLSKLPVHFKKRMITSAARTDPGGKLEAMPAVIGRTPSSVSRPFSIHNDQPSANISTPTTSAPPAQAKIGIVISHGRAMTLQDKLQMGSLSATAAVQLSGLQPSGTAVHRKAASGSRLSGKFKRKSSLAVRHAAVKRSLHIAQARTPKSEDENISSERLPYDAPSCRNGPISAKRPCIRKSTKRSELALLLELDGGLLAASAEFRKANALRPRDNVISSPVAGNFPASRLGQPSMPLSNSDGLLHPHVLQPVVDNNMERRIGSSAMDHGAMDIGSSMEQSPQCLHNGSSISDRPAWISSSGKAC